MTEYGYFNKDVFNGVVSSFRGEMMALNKWGALALIALAGCTSTGTNDAGTRIQLSDGTEFVGRTTARSSCNSKLREIRRVSNIMEPEGFVKRGRGEVKLFGYQVDLLSDFADNCVSQKKMPR